MLRSDYQPIYLGEVILSCQPRILTRGSEAITYTPSPIQSYPDNGDSPPSPEAERNGYLPVTGRDESLPRDALPCRNEAPTAEYTTVILHQLFFRCGFDLGNRGFGWKFVH